MFSHVFFARLKPRYLRCFRALHKTSGKQLHLAQNNILQYFFIKVLCFLMFSLRWLFIRIYRAPGSYVKQRGNITCLCSFNIPGKLRCLVSFDGRHKRIQFYVGSCNYVYRRENIQKHYGLCGYSYPLNDFSHIVGNLPCILSFRLRYEPMRFYVVFAGTCTL